MTAKIARDDPGKCTKIGNHDDGPRYALRLTSSAHCRIPPSSSAAAAVSMESICRSCADRASCSAATARPSAVYYSAKKCFLGFEFCKTHERSRAAGRPQYFGGDFLFGRLSVYPSVPLYAPYRPFNASLSGFSAAVRDQVECPRLPSGVISRTLRIGSGVYVINR